MFLAHSTMLKSSLAASSQMLSIPMALSGPLCWLYWCPYRLPGYGSARSSWEMSSDTGCPPPLTPLLLL